MNCTITEKSEKIIIFVFFFVFPIYFVSFFKSFLEFLPELMIKSEDNPTPPRVLVAQTQDDVKVPLPVTMFPKTPVITPALSSLKAFVDRCRQNEDETFVARPYTAADSASRYAENIMAFFCSLVSIDWPLP